MKTKTIDLTKKITLEKLVQLGACLWGSQDFEKVFPSGAMLTEKNLELAARKNLSIGWLLNKATTPRERVAHDRRVRAAQDGQCRDGRCRCDAVRNEMDLAALKATVSQQRASKRAKALKKAA